MPCLATTALIRNSCSLFGQNTSSMMPKIVNIHSKLVYDRQHVLELQSVTRMNMTTWECLRSLRVLCRQNPAVYGAADSSSSIDRQWSKRRRCGVMQHFKGTILSLHYGDEEAVRESRANFNRTVLLDLQSVLTGKRSRIFFHDATNTKNRWKGIQV